MLSVVVCCFVGCLVGSVYWQQQEVTTIVLEIACLVSCCAVCLMNLLLVLLTSLLFFRSCERCDTKRRQDVSEKESAGCHTRTIGTRASFPDDRQSIQSDGSPVRRGIREPAVHQGKDFPDSFVPTTTQKIHSSIWATRERNNSTGATNTTTKEKEGHTNQSCVHSVCRLPSLGFLLRFEPLLPWW